MANLYVVYELSKPDFSDPDPKATTVVSFVVNDAASEKVANNCPDAAVFPISVRHDKDTQKKRAYKFAAYLNSMVTIMNDLEKDQEI